MNVQQASVKGYGQYIPADLTRGVTYLEAQAALAVQQVAQGAGKSAYTLVEDVAGQNGDTKRGLRAEYDLTAYICNGTAMGIPTQAGPSWWTPSTFQTPRQCQMDPATQDACTAGGTTDFAYGLDGIPWIMFMDVKDAEGKVTSVEVSKVIAAGGVDAYMASITPKGS